MSTVQNHLPVFAQREVRTLRRGTATIFAVLLMALLSWSWLPFLKLMVGEWFSAPEYGVGATLAVVALLILFIRRKHVDVLPPQTDGLGCVLILSAVLGRFAGTALGIEFAEGGTWILGVLGIGVLCAGRQNLPWLLPPILFLGFLLPLPYRIVHAAAGPLQQAITAISVYMVQLCGYAGASSGTLLLVDDATVDISQMVLGIGTLVPFLAVATGVAMLFKRPMWQRAFLVGSGVPIALGLLAARAAAVAIMEASQNPLFEQISRYGLWYALLIAVVLCLFELRLVNRLFIEPDAVPVSEGSRLKDALPVVVSDATEASQS